MRQFPRGFLAVSLTASGILLAGVRADAPPSDIDKPRGEAPEVEMGEAGGKDGSTSKDHEALHKKLADESEANLKKIAELMDKIRGKLSQKQTGDATQTDQREVIKELQELIDKVGKG